MKIKDYRPIGLPASASWRIAVSSVALNLLLWILVLTTFPKNDPSAILHYTAGVGIDFVGNPWQIFVLPSMGLVMLLLNALLGRFVRGVNEVAFWIFWTSMPILEGMLIGVYIMLLRLNS